jgi:hypothetical protein
MIEALCPFGVKKTKKGISGMGMGNYNNGGKN